MKLILSDIQIVPATKDDALAIANIHARSWQEHYKDMWSEEYLKDHCAEERMKVWRNRMISPSLNQRVLLAKSSKKGLLGFACIYINHHPNYGTLLDNLHVKTQYHGNGIGKALLRNSANEAFLTIGDGPYYCWVLTDNEASKRFYILNGGKEGKTEIQEGPKNVSASATMINWSSTKSLMP